MLATTLSPTWETDALLADFSYYTLHFPSDDEGQVIATLLRRQPLVSTTRAVLYIHGFIDYFFQEHLSQWFVDQGFNFYALDLRKYGRSLLPGQRPNFCRDIHDYYPEISAAIRHISDIDQNDFILLNGHSMGGLIATSYAYDGVMRSKISALFLNSPFFAFAANPLERMVLPLLANLGRSRPFIKLQGLFSPIYAQSIHHSYHGEWDFNTDWKPIEGFPIYLGWLAAIYKAQRQIQRGLDLQLPILVLHSDRSTKANRWDDNLLSSDGVLDVADIRRYSLNIGPRTECAAITGGMHDLTLSQTNARAAMFERLGRWLDLIA